MLNYEASYGHMPGAAHLIRSHKKGIMEAYKREIQNVFSQAYRRKDGRYNEKGDLNAEQVEKRGATGKVYKVTKGAVLPYHDKQYNTEDNTVPNYRLLEGVVYKIPFNIMESWVNPRVQLPANFKRLNAEEQAKEKRKYEKNYYVGRETLNTLKGTEHYDEAKKFVYAIWGGGVKTSYNNWYFNMNKIEAEK